MHSCHVSRISFKEMAQLALGLAQLVFVRALLLGYITPQKRLSPRRLHICQFEAVLVVVEAALS
jgi:hypothetical protein